MRIQKYIEVKGDFSIFIYLAHLCNSNTFPFPAFDLIRKAWKDMLSRANNRSTANSELNEIMSIKLNSYEIGLLLHRNRTQLSLRLLSMPDK